MIEIHHADCFDFMAGMADKEVDMVFTSPPYNRERNDKYKHYNDTQKDYFGFLVKLIGESLRVSKHNVFVNVQTNYYNSEAIYRVIGKFASQVSQIFTWVKTNPMPSRHHVITNQYEWVIAFRDLEPKDKVIRNVIQTSVAKMIPEHKAMMHPDISDFFIRNFAPEGSVVLDPFFGTGTTGISCHKYDVSCIGVDISLEYCRIARDRILQYVRPEQLRLL